MRFSWQSDRPSHKGGIQATCFRQFINFGFTSWAMLWTYDEVEGHAIPVGDQFEDDRESPGGGGECAGVMMESYLWWYDQFGQYQEEVTRRWCQESGIWET